MASIRLFDYDTAPPDHIRGIYGDIYQALNPEVYPDQSQRLGYILPRDHGKSESITHVCPSWLALRNPNIRILIMSESFDQAKRKLGQCRDTIKRLGPQYGREIDTSNYKELTLERDENHDVATIQAAGVDSGVTGGHFDVIIFDDVVSWKSQRTAARRDKIEKQFKEHLNLKSGEDTVMVVVGTRKHPNDLYNFLIENPTWDVTVKPAIADASILDEGAYDIITDTGNRYDDIGDVNPREETIVDVEPHYEVDVLWPERKPLDTLIMDMLEASASGQGAPVWRREMLAEADALMGEILNEDMFTYVAPDDVPDDLPTYVGVDLAIVDDPEAAAMNDTDYTAIAKLLYDSSSDETYLDEIKRRRGMSLSQAIDWLGNQVDDPKKILVEANQAQSFFVQSAQDAGLDVEPTTSSGKKEDRIISMSSRFESGKVKLVESEKENDDRWAAFASEWVEFPSGRHDDQLDATEIGLRGIEEQSNESSYALFSGTA
ncbi:Phage protein [Natrarchaeobaculum sulfurireducens]|uniref:Phage protein n=1 Tax=Natrarchaeobaculum sulfurireducens TaxID=2044521 RepID=A0A346PPR3_9EURY|nr:Phage protein [Natrarchaeobaculum sulfurireducens]